MKKFQARQGDVFVKKVKSMPEGLNPVPLDKGRVILAYGEVTGHMHSLDSENCKLFVCPDTAQRFLEITSYDALTHDEHDSIRLGAGIYKVIQQREYNYGTNTPVRD